MGLKIMVKCFSENNNMFKIYIINLVMLIITINKWFIIVKLTTIELNMAKKMME